MAKHFLSLDIEDVSNTCILRVADTSIYSTTVPVTCPLLEITPPGFTRASSFTNRTPMFVANITACDLGIQMSNCGNYANVLVDGIYIIRWSVAPNEVVNVEYNHLRIANIMAIYKNVACALDLANCTPDIETQKQTTQLQFIRTLIDAAKAQVEVAHHPKKGLEIYNYARTELNKLARFFNVSC